MKKMLTLLAVTAIPAMLGGCSTCCPPGLCSWCPCNCFNRQPDPCPPAPVYAAPLATACPPMACPPAGMSYASPMAAPFTAAPSYVQPQMATCCPQQPMYYQAAPTQFAEPGCGYVESSCGAPYTGMGMGMGMVSYGPEMPVEYGPCGSGCCEPGAVTPPAPEAYVEPRPAGE